MTEILTEWFRVGDWAWRPQPDGTYLTIRHVWKDPGWVWLWQHRGPGRHTVNAEGETATVEEAMARADEHIATQRTAVT
jgi:hypothetical protein